VKRTGFITTGAVSAIAVLAAVAGYSVSAQPVEAPAAAPAPGAPTSFADIVEKVAPAVVSIEVESKASRSPVAFENGDGGSPFSFSLPNGQQLPFGFNFKSPQGPDGDAPPQRAQGSGFFISADGYVVTNNHVVDGADKITVRTKDGARLVAHVVGEDPATDLAVVKVDGANFPYVDFERRAEPRVGDWVVAVGNPYGLGGTATAGIVSALARKNMSNSSYVDYMQIDAPINRGNSGGPTFDVYGRVVGVNTAIFSPSGGSVGIGFDIPADVAAGVTHELIEHGKIVRGFIGATVQDLSPDIAESLGRPANSGALVADVTAGGPSSTAGLKPGDIVEKVDGRPVTSAADLTRAVALARAGDQVRLEVRRGDATREVDVRSGVRPTEASLAEGPGAGENGRAANSELGRVLGMQLQPNPKGGVTIEGLSGASDAAQKGLRPGDVILKAGERTTATAADVAAAVDAAKKAGHKDVLLLVDHNGRNLFIPLEIPADKG
jgi:serine protease Do